jgi:membrane-associated phospholipid phosphatase
MRISACRATFFVLTLFILSLKLYAQSPSSSLAGEPDARSSQPKSEISPERPVSWKAIPQNIIQDQKSIWTFPLQVARGKHWKPVLGFVAVTAALVALDPYDTPYFKRTPRYAGFDKVFSGRNTSLGMAIVPASFLVAGMARHDTYAQHTALLAAEAFADSEILSTIIKDGTHRVRPSDLPLTANYSDTWFEARNSILGKHSGFPSGHAIAAFSIATVFARRYRQHRWVPWVSYGLASLVVFSRLPLQAHFPSDVFAGAALGYFISRGVVLQNH